MGLGTLNVQGIDYAYTLQGWIKYINGPALNINADIGKDGNIGLGGNDYKWIARDVMSYGISYFDGEYKPIMPGSYLMSSETIPNAGTGNDLFNGNIRATSVQLSQLGGIKTYSYRYDQLNRIVKMRKHETTYSDGGGTPVFTVGAPGDEYKENITYDKNGNIQSYLRNGTASNLAMDNLTYIYDNVKKNQLKTFTDPVAAGNYTEDVNDPGVATNFTYDKIGNLVSDVEGKIEKIEWTVYGKIKKIKKVGNKSPIIEYEYDASGNRIFKKVSSGVLSTYTYYVRDAQGNTIAVYSKIGEEVIWSEQHLYGSSRIGMMTPGIAVPSTAGVPTPGSSMEDGFEYGQTFYEMSNHLGNVLATISDKKVGIDDAEYAMTCPRRCAPLSIPGVVEYCGCASVLVSGFPDGIVDYFKAEVITQTDYYPFGMQIPGRTYRAGSGYRYGFNGKENDNEVKGEGNSVDFGARIYDPRISRWLSVDAYADKYPNVSPYSYCINSPLQFKDANGHWLVDKNGNIIYTTDVPVYEIKDNYIYEVSRYYFYTNDGQEVEVLKYNLKTTLDNVIWADEEHKVFKDFKDRGDKLIALPDSGPPELSSCHGNTLKLLPGKDFYIAGLDNDNKDNVSKIFKNTAEFTPVKAEDVKPGDVAIFDDGNGNIAHSATVDKVKKHGKKVRLTSKDDRNPVKHNQSIKNIQKTNPAYKRFVGYYRHNANKQIDTDLNAQGWPGYAGSRDQEQIKQIVEEVKKKG